MPEFSVEISSKEPLICLLKRTLQQKKKEEENKDGRCVYFGYLQVEEMYKKAHDAIREDPERKATEKKPFKGKRCVLFVSLYNVQPIGNDETNWKR